jgi:ubiquinone/menaquinone biosynthesis C-methylase UbiE
MERYSAMQYNMYINLANRWSIDNRDPVVGTFDAHNDWKDYDDYLFRDLPTDTTNLVALDFGCGPARNLVKYGNKFQIYDGVDICEVNLENGKKWILHNDMDLSKHRLYKCNGTDLSSIGTDTYDIITSTIALQHICVHEIRFNYFKEFFRILKSGGMITLQMGYGYKYYGENVGYYENKYDATATNGLCDTRVDDPTQLEDDLKKVGFTDFKYYIRPVGPGDCHANWIFFSARKI